VILYIMLCGYPPFYGDCSRTNCEWDEGLPCRDCQDSLFSRIQTGKYVFPEEDWGCISRDAKDLIKHLLVKDVRLRYSVDDVLGHPWITGDAPNTPLQTPDVLLRNDSARDLCQLAEHFVAVNRLVLNQRSSFSKQRRSFSNRYSSSSTGSSGSTVAEPSSVIQKTPIFINAGDNHFLGKPTSEAIGNHAAAYFIQQKLVASPMASPVPQQPVLTRHGSSCQTDALAMDGSCLGKRGSEEIKPVQV
jgi:serine/threonine protein kinase